MKQKTTATNAIQTESLGKRYGSLWALKECTIMVPQGSLSALVGPNGAGKTTLLKLLAGLSSPSTGSSTVLGGLSPKQSREYIAEVGYLAQEIPLYKQLSASKHIVMGAHLNIRWDNDFAVRRLQELGIPLDRPVGALSGGQRAQVALTIALAKKPRLLLLDEPVAALDPLARSNFLTSLSQAVADADDNLTVVMSSHLLADLEQICDHLVVLAAGETQLCDSIERVLETHKQLVGPRTSSAESSSYTIIKERHSERETMLLVRLRDTSLHNTRWRTHSVDLEDIVLAYMERASVTDKERTTKGDA